MNINKLLTGVLVTLAMAVLGLAATHTEPAQPDVTHLMVRPAPHQGPVADVPYLSGEYVPR